MSDAYDLMAALVLDDGRRWGEAALDFQKTDAAAVLDLDGPRRHYWTRPRGASKTTDLAGVGVAALLDQLPANARGYVYAADKEQSGLLLDSAAGFADRTPELGSALTVGASTLTAARTGATLTIESSDDASAFGKRPAFTIVEEFSIWKTTRGPTRLWAAIASAVPKVPGSRLVVLAMAGDPAHPSYKVLQRARASDSWRVSEVKGPTPWWDPDDLAEVRADLTETDFRRLVLGEWCEGDERLSSVDDLAACVRLDGPRDPAVGRYYCMGLDLGLSNDATVLSVCSLDEAEGAAVVSLDRQMVWQGTRQAPVNIAEVEEAVLQAWRIYGQPAIVVDPWQAAGLCQRLRTRGVEVIEYAFTQQSGSRLAVRLHRLIADGALALPDDEALLDELANVRLLEPSPGVYRLDHLSGEHNDRAMSLALAAHGLLAQDLATGPEYVYFDPMTGGFSVEEPGRVFISEY